MILFSQPAQVKLWPPHEGNPIPAFETATDFGLAIPSTRKRCDSLTQPSHVKANTSQPIHPQPHCSASLSGVLPTFVDDTSQRFDLANPEHPPVANCCCHSKNLTRPSIVSRTALFPGATWTRFSKIDNSCSTTDFGTTILSLSSADRNKFPSSSFQKSSRTSTTLSTNLPPYSCPTKIWVDSIWARPKMANLTIPSPSVLILRQPESMRTFQQHTRR
jgi:hypothetical protein